MNSSGELLEWKRAEIAIKKFIEATSIHLDMLSNHQKAMAKLRLVSDRGGLLREKCNAERTMRQLINDTSQIMQIGVSLKRDDLCRFESEVNPIKRKIETGVHDFLAECEKCGLNDPTGNDSGTTAESNQSGPSKSVIASYDDQVQHVYSDTSLAAVIEDLEQNAKAHNQLMQDISELKECMDDISKLINSQGEFVDRVSSNVDKSLIHVQLGEKFLKEASKHKVVIGGAVLGAMIGGPVGFVIGSKAAVLAALSGSAIGAYGSNMISKRGSEKYKEELRMTNLQHSSSVDYPKID